MMMSRHQVSRSVSSAPPPPLRTSRSSPLPPASTKSVRSFPGCVEKSKGWGKRGSSSISISATSFSPLPPSLRSALFAASSCHHGGGGGAAVTTSRSVRTVASASRALGQGDFAGLTANFRWPSGDLIEVPQHLVPKALVEWGQVPTCLEVLTSEGPDGDCNPKTIDVSEPSRKMARYTVAVLPSIGCSVDNLETTTSVIEQFESYSILPSHSPTADDEAWPVRVITYWPTNDLNRRRIVVEATFPIGNPVTSGTGENFDCQLEDHRIRMSVPLELKSSDGSWSVELVSPVSITFERMVSEESSWGTVADGGGLDGQSVSRMLGPFLRQSYDVFAQKSNHPSSLSPVAEFSECLQESAGSNEACASFLALPCNMTLSASRSTSSVADFEVCIGHIDASPKPGSTADTEKSFVHKVLHVRVPITEPNHPEESPILDPPSFVFATRVDRLSP